MALEFEAAAWQSLLNRQWERDDRVQPMALGMLCPAADPRPFARLWERKGVGRRDSRLFACRLLKE